MNPRTSMAQREDIIRRTVTEEQLDSLFIGFGQTLVVCFYVVRLRKAENFNLVLSLALIAVVRSYLVFLRSDETATDMALWQMLGWSEGEMRFHDVM
uniref:Uncharacterized protein n=2 Tax=Brassica oleracea TaxID=3712 RepID=A0A0D3BFJ9_BRAOL